ncbi:MAG: PaaI family thioesterase [Dehalococcoidia bacterium]
METAAERQRRWQQLKATLEAEPFWLLLGVTIDEIGEGRCRLRLPLTEGVRNFASGPAHGGVLSSLIDVAVAVALDSLYLPDMAGHTTIELSVSFLEAASSGTVFAEGRIVRVGRTIAVGEAEVRTDDGKLVAVGRASYMIFRRNEG